MPVLSLQMLASDEICFIKFTHFLQVLTTLQQSLCIQSKNSKFNGIKCGKSEIIKLFTCAIFSCNMQFSFP